MPTGTAVAVTGRDRPVADSVTAVAAAAAAVVVFAWTKTSVWC